MAAINSNLTYYILEGVLTGNVGGKYFNVYAYSGGGGGSTVNKPDMGNVFQPYSTGRKTSGKGTAHKHGGAVPVGRYVIKKPTHHPHLGLSAYCDPMEPNNMMNRGGFYIHNRGPHGSDGCIVPKSRFEELMDALKKTGGGVLFVQETIEDLKFG
jgi:hypothetical protein